MLNFYSKKELICLSLNTLTAPKFQGRGLFIKMAIETYNDCFKENIKYIIGFPNPNSYPGFVRKLNFSHLGNIPLLIKPINYIGILRSLFKRRDIKHGGEIFPIES